MLFKGRCSSARRASRRSPRFAPCVGAPKECLLLAGSGSELAVFTESPRCATYNRCLRANARKPTSCADVLLLPSHGEGLPLTLQEAMLCGARPRWSPPSVLCGQPYGRRAGGMAEGVPPARRCRSHRARDATCARDRGYVGAGHVGPHSLSSGGTSACLPAKAPSAAQRSDPNMSPQRPGLALAGSRALIKTGRPGGHEQRRACRARAARSRRIQSRVLLGRAQDLHDAVSQPSAPSTLWKNALLCITTEGTPASPSRCARQGCRQDSAGCHNRTRCDPLSNANLPPDATRRRALGELSRTKQRAVHALGPTMWSGAHRVHDVVERPRGKRQRPRIGGASAASPGDVVARRLPRTRQPPSLGCYRAGAPPRFRPRTTRRRAALRGAFRRDRVLVSRAVDDGVVLVRLLVEEARPLWPCRRRLSFGVLEPRADAARYQLPERPTFTGEIGATGSATLAATVTQARLQHDSGQKRE